MTNTQHLSQQAHQCLYPAAWLLPALLAVLLSGCSGDPIGTACKFEGSGFHASTNCQYRCLETRAIQCPEGNVIRPAVCSGTIGCQPGGCGPGQVCYTMQDPFEEESFCVTANLCGSYQATTLADWEQTSASSAATLRAEYEARKRRREAAGAQSTLPQDHQ